MVKEIRSPEEFTQASKKKEKEIGAGVNSFPWDLREEYMSWREKNGYEPTYSQVCILSRMNCEAEEVVGEMFGPVGDGTGAF